jgi:hypothetical protein
MAVRLRLACDPGLRRVTVEPVGDRDEIRTVTPLTRFLRAQPPWAGPGHLEIHVNYPNGVRRAFVPGTSFRSVEELEDAAAIVWHDVEGGSVLLEWQRRTRGALTQELRRLSREQPDLPFDRV